MAAALRPLLIYSVEHARRTHECISTLQSIAATTVQQGNIDQPWLVPDPVLPMAPTGAQLAAMVSALAFLNSPSDAVSRVIEAVDAEIQCQERCAAQIQVHALDWLYKPTGCMERRSMRELDLEPAVRASGA